MARPPPAKRRKTFPSFSPERQQALFGAQFTGVGAADWRAEAAKQGHSESDHHSSLLAVHWEQGLVDSSRKNYTTWFQWWDEWWQGLPLGDADRSPVAHPPAKCARFLRWLLRQAEEHGHKEPSDTVTKALKALQLLRNVQLGVPYQPCGLHEEVAVKQVLLDVRRERGRVLRSAERDPQTGGYVTAVLSAKEVLLIIEKAIAAAAAEGNTWACWLQASRILTFLTWGMAAGLRSEDARGCTYQLLGLPAEVEAHPMPLQLVTTTLRGGKENQDGYHEYASCTLHRDPLLCPCGFLGETMVLNIHVLGQDIVASIRQGDGKWKVTQQRHVTGNFNAHLMNKLLLVVDESVPSAEGMNTLKNLVSERQLVLEAKGKDALPVANYLRIWFLSNARPWLEDGQRRFCVQQAADKPEHMDCEYFAELACASGRRSTVAAPPR